MKRTLIILLGLSPGLLYAQQKDPFDIQADVKEAETVDAEAAKKLGRQDPDTIEKDLDAAEKEEAKATDGAPDADVEKEVDRLQKEADAAEKADLSKPDPALAEREAAISKEYKYSHVFKFGVATSSSYYKDQALSGGMYIGAYRPWMKYRYDDKFQLFLRGKASVNHFLEAPANSEQTEWNQRAEIASARYKAGSHTLMVGRTFFNMGDGLIFANFADGAWYTLKTNYSDFRMMGMYSGEYDKCGISVRGCGGAKSSFDNTFDLPIDSGVADAGKRVFGGAEITTPAFWGTRFFVLGLYTSDLIVERSENTRKFEINPYYGGAGFRGYIWSSRLRYALKGFYQGGDTHDKVDDATGESKASKLNSYAGLFDLTYTLPFLEKTFGWQLLFEGAYASGDEDKENVTSAVQTNTAGDDTAFQHFGSYSAGLGLKPRLTNIQVYRFGLQFKPLYMFYYFRQLGVRTKYTLYKKTVSKGAISDPAATEDNADIGAAIDVAVVYNWRSDIKLFYGFGMFTPGAAYPEGSLDVRAAHIVSATILF